MSISGPILLVEDDPEDIDLTLRAFRRNNLANEIIVVRDGAAAIDYLHRRGAYATRPPQQPILILLDRKMPKVDGMEVLRHIRSDPDLRRLPVIMMTSSVLDKDIIESYNLGVNGYVTKPVGFQAFTEAIRNICQFWLMENKVAPEPAV